MEWITLNRLSLIFLLLFQISLINCGKKEMTQGFEVAFTGALHSIMSGNLNPTASLDTLKNRANLYALGAANNLKGELQIFNSKPFHASIQDSTIVVDRSFDRKASLLVYTEVLEWEEIKIPVRVDTKTSLENFIQTTAGERGISMEKPFPFLIEGKVASLSWHVIDWPDGDTEHTHQKHRNSGLKGTLEGKEVTIIGFFSKYHKGVFTHHSTNMHMHFKTDDDLLAGHLDDVQVGNSMILKLPKK